MNRLRNRHKEYLGRFDLPADKQVKDLSRGMKMKLMLAVAMSHEAKLLILDEPTSGLDPVVHEELLDTLTEYISNGERTILFSTHITSDLERIADYITLIDSGFVYACFTIAVIFPLYFKFSYSKVYVVSNLPFYVMFIIIFDITRKKNLLQQSGPMVRHLASNLTIPAIGLALGRLLLALSCLLSCALTGGLRSRDYAKEGKDNARTNDNQSVGFPIRGEL